MCILSSTKKLSLLFSYIAGFLFLKDSFFFQIILWLLRKIGLNILVKTIKGSNDITT